MCSHRGRNGFSPHKNGSCSITQPFSRRKVSKSHCVISPEPFLHSVRTLSHQFSVFHNEQHCAWKEACCTEDHGSELDVIRMSRRNRPESAPAAGERGGPALPARFPPSSPRFFSSRKADEEFPNQRQSSEDTWTKTHTKCRQPIICEENRGKLSVALFR